MRNRLAAFWQGRIYFVARGDHLPRFINEALKDGITLFRMQRSEKGLRGQVALADFRRVRRAARVTGTRVRIAAKYGWPFVAVRWWRRKGLLAGAVMIIVVLGILSQMVLSVTVSGNKALDSGDVLGQAESLGLKKWIWHKDLDLNNLAKNLQERLPETAWVGLERQGTRVEIKIVEKTVITKTDSVGNLIANKAALIQDIMVIQGIPQVHEGQTVKAGQVLIEKAPILGNPAAPQQKQESTAKGFVRGRVWSSAEAEVPLVEDKIEETGRITHGFGIKFGSRAIMVTNPDSPYERFNKQEKLHSLPQWRNWQFPVEVISITYTELRSVHIERSVVNASLLAEQAAREEVKKKLTPGAKILKDKAKVLTGTGNAVRVRVEMETYEDLAVYANP